MPWPIDGTMGRFRFRLQGLLRLRTQMEKTARRTLATAMGNVTNVEQRMATATSGLAECERMGCGPDAHAPLARALAQGLARHRLRLQNELRAAHAQLERARGDWVERRREQRTLDVLRDKQREDWLLQRQRDEQHELEELARGRKVLAPTEEIAE
ncbi:MAG: flagellar FliJ family protein [Planctomycetota bacterium]